MPESEIYVSGEDIKEAVRMLRERGVHPSPYAEVLALALKLEKHYGEMSGKELELKRKETIEYYRRVILESGANEEKTEKALSELEEVIDPLRRTRKAIRDLLNPAVSEGTKRVIVTTIKRFEGIRPTKAEKAAEDLVFNKHREKMESRLRETEVKRKFRK